MLRNKIFQLRISEELLNICRYRSPNVSSYIRSLIRKDTVSHPNKNYEQLAEIRAKTPYIFFARLDEVSDGDTLFVIADLGFYIKARVKVRLLGIDAPPRHCEDGLKAKEFLKKELSKCQLVIETRKKGKYGRYLAYIYYHRKHKRFEDIIRHGKLINEELLKAGLAEKI